MTIIREDLLGGFAFWSTILVAKMLAMAPLTARQRFAKKAFANPEDLDFGEAEKVVVDEDVERVRRAHLNDMENILPWFVMTIIWLTTGPSYFVAMLVIRTYVISRIFHTIAYVFWARQPWRAHSYAVGLFITLYEVVATLIHYF